MIRNSRGHCILWHKYVYFKHKGNTFMLPRFVRHRECKRCDRIEHEHVWIMNAWIEVRDCNYQQYPIDYAVGF